MPFSLAHQTIAARDATASRSMILLHGIYGSGRNWKTFATDFVAARPEWEIVLPDLRNHGSSQRAPPPHTLDSCAADLEALAGNLPRQPEALCGHSFGGKVAVVCASRRGPGFEALRKLVLLDSPPGRGSADETSATEAAKVLAVMRRMPLPVASRAEAGRAIAAEGVAPAVAKWMATNLVPDARGGFAWHFDLDALAAMLDDYFAVDAWAFLERPPPDLAIHFVRAANSDRFTRDDVARLDALDRHGALRHHVLPDAAHWLHVDNPRGLLALLESILDGLASPASPDD